MLYKVQVSSLAVRRRGAWASAKTDENKLVNGGSYTRIFGPKWKIRREYEIGANRNGRTVLYNGYQ